MGLVNLDSIGSIASRNRNRNKFPRNIVEVEVVLLLPVLTQVEGQGLHASHLSTPLIVVSNSTFDDYLLPLSSNIE